MIFYLDTSSLVKLYVEEEGSTEIGKLAEKATMVATSSVAYVEARAAFARKYREENVEEKAYRKILENLEKDWENYFIIEVTEGLVRLAGNLAEKYALRGFDAIHLASATILRRKIPLEVTFSCSDENLQEAAKKEELMI